MRRHETNMWQVGIDQGFPDSSVDKESACNAEDLGLIPGIGRSPGEGKATHSTILAWRIPWTIHGVSKSWTQLRDFHFLLVRKLVLQLSCSFFLKRNKVFQGIGVYFFICKSCITWLTASASLWNKIMTPSLLHAVGCQRKQIDSS